MKNKAAISQPAPKPGKINILEEVLKDLQDRSDMGLKKYLSRLYSDNGRDALMDAYQEALDLVMYLRQVIAERDSK